MSNTDTVQAIEKAIQHSKELVELGKVLERLRSNRDFKKLIIEGYLEKECIRLVLLKADQNMQTVERQASIVKQMDAIGSVDQYFQTVFVKASMAEKSLELDEQERDLLVLEGL